MKTSNPTLYYDTFSKPGTVVDMDNAMTINGVVWKTVVLLLGVIVTAAYTWSMFFKAGAAPSAIYHFIIAGAIVGFGIAILTVFKPEWSPVTAPLYALAEGFFVGGVSAALEYAFPGVIIQAVTLTFATMVAMLAIYTFGWINVTDKFRYMVGSATGGIALVYITTFILSLFGVNTSFLFGNGLLSILFSLFVVGIAALNFVLDFDFIYQGAERGAPKVMEWYGAFALIVTIIWLYIEFLRLASNLRGR